MIFYICDNQGNIWGESEDFCDIEFILSCISDDDIKLNELEIVEGI